TELGRPAGAAIAARRNVKEPVMVARRVSVVAVSPLEFRRGVVGKAARVVHDASLCGGGNGGSTYLAPPAATRRAVNRDSGVRVGVGCPIGRAAMRSGDVANDELVVGERLIRADAAATTRPDGLNPVEITAAVTNDVRSARGNGIGRGCRVIRLTTPVARRGEIDDRRDCHVLVVIRFATELPAVVKAVGLFTASSRSHSLATEPLSRAIAALKWVVAKL